METRTVGELPGERRSRRRPGENRERLLAAGILEFSLHGYRGTSTTVIAALAEVPQPHVYTNFRTKQELFLGCLARAAESLRGETFTPPHGALAYDSEALARLLLQAVSALGEESLRAELEPQLRGFREALGAAEFEALLLRGARSLLDG